MPLVLPLDWSSMIDALSPRPSIQSLPRSAPSFHPRALDLPSVRANDRDLAVPLENRPLHLLQPLDPRFVHRRENFIGCDALVIKRFGKNLPMFDEHRRARLHEAP